jgi:hypothetical protein
MSKHYILDGHDAKEAELFEWAKWFETSDRRVKVTAIDGVKVSTVFLGLDHNWGDGPPLIFETMVFGGKFDQDQDRYSTWDEAIAGHDEMVLRVKAG